MNEFYYMYVRFMTSEVKFTLPINKKKLNNIITLTNAKSGSGSLIF